jgi:hypothetical protein
MWRRVKAAEDYYETVEVCICVLYTKLGTGREDAIQGDGECGLPRCRNPSKHPCLQVSLSWPDGMSEGAKGAAIGTISLALTRIAIVKIPWRHITLNHRVKSRRELFGDGRRVEVQDNRQGLAYEPVPVAGTRSATSARTCVVLPASLQLPLPLSPLFGGTHNLVTINGTWFGEDSMDVFVCTCV